MMVSNTSRYKTELCRPFEENGTCKYGEKCQFAHGLSELRTLTRHPKYKTEFCRTFHTTGFCPYGPRCHFIHNSKTPTAASHHQSSPIQSLAGSYGASHHSLPFGHQSSQYASPSTSPISSTSSANGSLSSADSTVSSSSPSSISHHHHHHHRLSDVPTSHATSYSPYSTSSSPNSSLFHRHHSSSSGRHNSGSSSIHKGITSSMLLADRHQAQALSGLGGDRGGGISGARAGANPSRRVENDDEVSHSSGCASENQRLFWLHSHSHMHNSEGSRWPPSMCAIGLIGNSNNARRSGQMQA